MSPFMLLSQALKNFFERDIQPFFKCDSMMGQIRAFTSSEFNFEPGGSIFLSKQGAVRSHKISSIFFFFLTKIGRSVDPLARPFTNVGPGSKEVEILFNVNYHAKCEQFKTRFFLNVRYF